MSSTRKTPSGRDGKPAPAARKSSGTAGKASVGNSGGGKTVKSTAPSKKEAEYELKPALRPEIKKEILAVALFAVALLLFISVYVTDNSGFLGNGLKTFMTGTMGFGAYTLPFIALLWGISLILGKNSRPTLPRFFFGLGLFVVILSFIHIAGFKGAPPYDSVGQYVSGYYENGGVANGGLFGAIIGNFLMGFLGKPGACVLLAAVAVVLFILITGRSFIDFLVRIFLKIDKELTAIGGDRGLDEPDDAEEYDYYVTDSRMKQTPEKPYKRLDKRQVFDYVVSGEGEDDDWDDEPAIHLMTDKRKTPPADFKDKIVSIRRNSDGKPGYYAGTSREEVLETDEPPFDVDMTDQALEGLAMLGSSAASLPVISVRGVGVEGYVPITVTVSDDDMVDAAGLDSGEVSPAPVKIPVSKSKPDVSDDIADKPYTMPSVDLLTINNYTPSPSSKAQILENSRKLEETLKSFGVEARVVEVSKGPTVTRYELSPGTGVKVSKISNLADDLALNLAAMGIRIEAPVPGKSVVGIEIPNSEIQTVFLRDVVDDDDFWAFPSKLSFAVGKDIAGNTVIMDIARMPHLLIAGATGSGKSVCVNTIIASILFKSAPDEVRMLMIDPKVVELNVYNGIPHLEIPVVTDPMKAAGALSWAVREMNERYNLFALSGTRDLKGYNETLSLSGHKPLPQIVIIIDELADLMMTCRNDVEQNICRLAQKARAAGIHLIIATQRPSVDVITGLIKANIPSRLAFAVTSGTDSRTILDMNGAEKLLGKGDMLFLPAGLAKPQRIQGAFISDKEVERLVSFIKSENGVTVYDQDKVDEITAVAKADEEPDGDADTFLSEAVEFVTEKGKASVSMLQRRFRIGYNRAARLMETLEAKGVVGPEDGVKPRKVLDRRWGD